MVNEKTWKDFRDSGLLWFINQTLHLFGWALVAEIEEDEIKRVYPARVKFRGFDEDTNSNGYVKLSEYLKNNIDDLHKESKE
ncbi:hypothetical protein CIL05_07495 [Virgibacillus profundi]|uniref:Uncharacterized protein n=1 Tax=Virgibacillus profundi TaxID=2024555 RepID=A0A2A2IGP3_9BACI|nr:hypothetical protein [Virgibacillus profundi]PAV30305.1 hypothetical protein CIL05_07495 [Virgibacillus profundi]PXY54477.1 hypothetical protein CIT14_07580 [Virgibacillus profundi]